MLRRFSILRLAVLFALCAGIGSLSVGTAKAADTSTSIFHIENDKQQVTIKDAGGKTLVMRHVATPTLRAVVSAWREGDKSAPPRVSLSLEDANGLRLWDMPITVPRYFKAHGSMQCRVNVNDKTPGSELEITFSESKETPKPDADQKPEAFSMVFVLGANGLPVSVDAIDSSGEVHHSIIDMSPQGVTMTGPDGTKAHIDTTDADGKSKATVEIDGNKITVTSVEKDGKHYFSFPYNGHQLLIEQGCTFTLDGEGNMTINAPAGDAKK